MSLCVPSLVEKVRNRLYFWSWLKLSFFLHRKRNQRVIYSYDKKQNSHWPLVNVLDSYTKRGPGSGIARIVEGYHSFTCTPCVSSASRMSHTCLCLPSRSWYSFTDPGGMEGWVDLGAKIPQAEIRTCNLPIGNPVLYHTATSAVTSSQAVWGRLYRRLIN